MNKEKSLDVGILIAIISVLSGSLLNSKIVEDIIEKVSKTVVVFFIEIAFLMLFSSSVYYIASVRLSKEEYNDVATMQVLVSLGILAGLTMFWASLYIVSANPQNIGLGKLITVYILLFVVLLILIYSQFNWRSCLRNVQKLFGIVVDTQSTLDIGMAALSVVLLIALVYNGLSHALTLLFIVMLPAFGIKIEDEAQKVGANKVKLYRSGLLLLSISTGAILGIAYLVQNLNRCRFTWSPRSILDIIIILYTVYVFLQVGRSKFNELNVDFAEVLGISLIVMIGYYQKWKQSSPPPSCFAFLEFTLLLYAILAIPTYGEELRRFSTHVNQKIAKKDQRKLSE
ncbi:hypothetical protein A3L09_00125 [Thermococcus profundus]|uniref:Uncharacterized protein n=1 Tax=Thermococcus profundus TaxID=49899 RepID=A0A2Z2M8V4_THEPR|nr:hypothetical protein [Thermococcus profundus]ASJ01779.1 hypothetical protein A3L09_00125 [Thermococcus profundus]